MQINRDSDPVGTASERAGAIRVMVVDDSAVIRGMTKRILAEFTDIEVVASAANGQQALNRLREGEIDIILLDIEMPVMDGLTALPLLLKEKPEVKIIMASSLTQPNARVSLQALRAGAADYVPKPSTTMNLSADSFKLDLLRKIRALGETRTPPALGRTRTSNTSVGFAKVASKGKVATRLPSQVKPKALAVGSSTGGPNALFAFFKALSPSVNIPVFVTQHMPATFTKILAEHITESTPWTCHEAKQDQRVVPGEIYLAPGDFHMLIKRVGNEIQVDLGDGPKESFCRPAVDPMLRSMIEIYGNAFITTILTGMGGDGLKGSEQLVAAGGTVIAQDEDSSVVWGMPGAVAQKGLCSMVAPIEELVGFINQKVRGARS